jgi:hypothetical protein
MMEMFLNNKYTNWYSALIEQVRAENRKRIHPYQYHSHHSIPKCFGGGGGENLVLLTPREHYICHLLLVRMTEGTARSKMVYALFHFKPKEGGVTSSLAFEAHLKRLGRYVKPHSVETRKKISDSNLGRVKTQEERANIRRSRLGRKHSEESRMKMSLSGRMKRPWNARKATPEARAKMSAAAKGRKSPMEGKTHSEETRRKMSAASTGKIQSPETIEKRRLSLLGKTRTPEQKLRISLSLTGKRPTEETKAKMRVAKLGTHHSQETKDKMRAAHRHHSQETKDKMRAAHRARRTRIQLREVPEQVEVLDPFGEKPTPD